MKEVFEGWAARDEDGDLCIYEEKPERRVDILMWHSSNKLFAFCNEDVLPNITWVTEPRKVIVTIETI